MQLANNIAVRRRMRGWTQEELAEQCGLSVRTIRNVELGLVRKPRRSSVELLTRALGETAEAAPPASRLDPDRWRGPQPPGTPLIGDRAISRSLAEDVRTHRLTTFLGPGGVGKTRSALAVAVEIGDGFGAGVVVVELGDLPSESRTGTPATAAIQRRIQRQIGWPEPSDRWADAGPAGRGFVDLDGGLLVILDNAEHVPAGVTGIARDFLSEVPGVHVLITARRPVTERLGVNREISPLPTDPDVRDPSRLPPATELVLRHIGVESPVAIDLAHDLAGLAELCRRLGGVPRYLEFAAERLRTVPIRHLLAGGPEMDMLCTNDHGLLRHQRSVAESILWNLDLLTDDHRRLLHRLARRGDRRFRVDDVVAECAGVLPAGVAPLALLSELLETTLVVAEPDELYNYRLAPYVGQLARQSNRH